MRHIIVPGRKLENGEISKIYKHRLDKAVKLYEAEPRGIELKIILSGGDPHGVEITEAKAGFDYISKIIKPEDLILEERSLCTVGNVAYSKLILLENKDKKPIIVSSCYHIPRVSYIFTYILGPDFEPAFVAAPTGLDKDKHKDHVKTEKEKMIESINFFAENSIESGDHEKLMRYFEKMDSQGLQGLVVKDLT